MKTLPTQPNVIFEPDFMSPEVATRFYEGLKKELSFKPDVMVRGDTVIETKRKYSFHGEYDYAYAGANHKPSTFTPTLNEIKELVEKRLPHNFNAVLCNYYDTDDTQMGYHADKEQELGDNPIIVSINLGQTRRFSFRYRRDLGLELPTTHRVAEFELTHGSLLIMGEDCQRYFEHSLLKKDKSNKDAVWPDRINLTFRKVLAPEHQIGKPWERKYSASPSSPSMVPVVPTVGSAFTFKPKKYGA